MKHLVKQYMQEEIEKFRDPQTGEVNTTFLAEDACSFFDAYEIPREYFDWALEVVEEHPRGEQ